MARLFGEPRVRYLHGMFAALRGQKNNEWTHTITFHGRNGKTTMGRVAALAIHGGIAAVLAARLLTHYCPGRSHDCRNCRFFNVFPL
jgi:hypothetical protein